MFAESAGADNDEYKSAAWRGMILGIVIGIVFLLILLLMAFQPALWS
jgi:Na+-driven multidrug efflux pump